MVFTCLIFMAGPYDYTVNIPQPPAQNFLQSLLGIQQLKGLQQQGEIAQQQAAIQQQQAAFQKEMQPLQLQAERARIGQIGQSMAASAEALRQGKITFEQAQQDRVRQMEQQAVAQARQQELFGKLNSLPANASMAEIVPIANQLALIKPEISKQIMDNFSALPEEYQKASKTALITATTQLEAGNIEGAKQTYSTLEQAIKNSAGNNSQLKAMADGIKAQGMILEANPNVGKLSALQMLGAVDTKALDSIVGLQKQEAETPFKAAELEGKRLDNKLKEIKLAGGMDPEEKMKLETAERVHVEAQPFVRKYIDSRTAFEMMKTADPTASGDEALLTQFVKMGDPGSVVSVTEKGGVKNVTLSDYIGSLQAKLAGEGSLGEAKRKELKDQAYKMLKASEKQYKEYEDKLTARYKKNGLDPENIFVLPSSEQLLEDAKKVEMSPEEQRMRSLLRPAAGFGNTMTPSQVPFQGSTFQGRPADVDAILKQLGVQ